MSSSSTLWGVASVVVDDVDELVDVADRMEVLVVENVVGMDVNLHPASSALSNEPRITYLDVVARN
jgi:hypothetical protein